jgi:hypothetical protein
MAGGAEERIDLQTLLAQMVERQRQEERHRRWKEQQEERRAEYEAHMERLDALRFCQVVDHPSQPVT